MSLQPEIPRPVKHRKQARNSLSVIAVTADAIHLERTGGTWLRSELPRIVQSEAPSLFVVQGAAGMLYELDQEFDSLPNWQYRVSPLKRDLVKPNGITTGRHVLTTVVSMFGFTAPKGSKKRGHFHHVLDPWIFSRWDGIHGVRPVDGEDELTKLFRWGCDLRDWCAAEGLRVTASSGGIANQLLRDPRFWPQARRKVPKATNEMGRVALPGNYYRLFGNTGESYTATYLDMRSAHHNLAREITFPDPDTLHRGGPWQALPVGTVGTVGTESHDELPEWVPFGTRRWERLARTHGLMLLSLSVPKIPETRFPPPYAERPGMVLAYVFTNELPMLRELGIAINYAVNAWVSHDTADGLNRYAEYALAQLDETDATRKAWLKGALLSPYGMLAARPRVQEFGYKRATGGEDRQYPAGRGLLSVKAKVSLTPHESPTANVIYRGMIEAEQRMRVLAMARDLHGYGANVLAIYADSVFVESHVALPLLPAPWRVEAYLDRLRFLSPTSFTSTQMTKLPGIPREQRQLLEVSERYRRSIPSGGGVDS